MNPLKDVHVTFPGHARIVVDGDNTVGKIYKDGCTVKAQRTVTVSLVDIVDGADTSKIAQAGGVR